MQPFLEGVKARGIRSFGENLVDTHVPIMFVVWAPGNTDQPHVGEPEIYRKTCFDPTINAYRSVMAKTTQGAIQMTMVDYDHEFAMKTLQHAFYVWKEIWLPRYAYKEHGMLLHGEIDLPMSYFSDEDEEDDDDEEESTDEEEEEN